MSRSNEYVEYIKIPNPLPKLQHRFQSCGGSNKNRKILIKYSSSGSELYSNALHDLQENILRTKEKYAYPIVFVNFVKHHLVTDKKIVFDDETLFKMRIWANQLRECKRNNELQNLDYLTYCIGDLAFKNYKLSDK